MSRFTSRQPGESALEQRYIARVLQEEAQNIEEAQDKKMSRFSSSDWRTRRSFGVQDTIMTMRHLPKHRFVDMRKMNTAAGQIKKRNHAIHNRIIFGHANNIVRGISFGFTDQVKKEMRELERKSNQL